MNNTNSQLRIGALVIFNRASKVREGWIHIVPRGELPNKEAGIMQVLDDPALDSIFNRLQADHSGADSPGLYAGREHFIYDSDKDSEALAWFKVFNRDAEGIWAKDEGLTDIGREAVKNKRYKFTSFVADSSDLQRVDSGQSGNSGLPKYRVMNIETVGFTNMANGKALLTPITNRKSGSSALLNFAGTTPADNNNHERQTMKSVLTELGLSADASEESAMAAVIKLKNRVSTLEPFEGEVTKLKNRVTDLDTQNVDSLLSSRGIKDEKILNRLKPVLAKMETVADRVGFLDDCGYKAAPAETTTNASKQTKLMNRETRPPGESTATSGKPERASRVMNRARELRKEMPTLTLLAAVQMAETQVKQ